MLSVTCTELIVISSFLLVTTIEDTITVTFGCVRSQDILQSTTPGKLKSYSFFLTTTQSILGIFASGLLLRELDSTEIKMI